MPAATSEFVAASFNVHAGIDGWGRPHDVLGHVPGDRRRRPRPPGVLATRPAGVSQADEVGDALGYAVTEVALAGGRRARPHSGATGGWMRSLDWRTASHALFLDSERPFPARVLASARYREAEPGSWGIAVLSRLPVSDTAVLPLPRLRRDRANRAVVALNVEVGGRKVGVAGTHMSHLSHGSALHFRAVARMLDGVFGEEPVLLAGDMNLWGPPIHAFLGQWRRGRQGQDLAGVAPAQPARPHPRPGPRGDGRRGLADVGVRPPAGLGPPEGGRGLSSVHDRARRVVALGAGGALIGGLAAWAALSDPFTAAADAVTALGIGVIWLEAAFRRRPVPAGPVPAAEPPLRWWPWLVLAVAIVGWELVSFFLGPRVQHPTLSSLYDSVTRWRAAKGVLFAGWLSLGAALARR